MKFLCRCGHVIVDQTDDLPYKGWVTRDKHQDRMITAAGIVAAFLRAYLSGTRSEWLRNHLGEEYAQTVEDDEAVILDLISMELDTSRLPLYLCVQCSRLWLQSRRQADLLLSYTPEHDLCDVLDVPSGEA